MQDTIVTLGALSLGGVVGWMTGKVFINIRRLDGKAVTAIIAIMLGPSASFILRYGTKMNVPPSEFMSYFIGLAALFAIWEYLAMRARRAHEVLKQKRIVKLAIQNDLRRRNYSIITFDRLRSHTHQDWSDEYLKEIIKTFPADFASATPDNKPGLIRLH
jgi:hypothetical protein